MRDTYKNMNIGDRIKLRGSEWTVVGVYKNTGGGSDSQALTDAETFMSAFNRNEYMQAGVTLAAPGDFQTLKEALTSDPSISVDVKTEAEMAQANFGQLYRIFDFVAYFIGAVMASGAIFGALNALYASVDTRRREIATLARAGFRQRRHRHIGAGRGAGAGDAGRDWSEPLSRGCSSTATWRTFRASSSSSAITPELAKTAIFSGNHHRPGSAARSRRDAPRGCRWPLRSGAPG